MRIEKGDINNWFVYILKCCDNTYYVGITNDLSARVKKHSQGKAAQYTAKRLPIKLVYYLGGYSQNDARKEEVILKDWRQEKKKKLINRLIIRNHY